MDGSTSSEIRSFREFRWPSFQNPRGDLIGWPSPLPPGCFMFFFFSPWLKQETEATWTYKHLDYDFPWPEFKSVGDTTGLQYPRNFQISRPCLASSPHELIFCPMYKACPNFYWDHCSTPSCYLVHLHVAILLYQYHGEWVPGQAGVVPPLMRSQLCLLNL